MKISSSEIDAFHAAYGALLRSSMNNLKKRDKKKEKQRHEEAIARRKRLEEDIPIIGPKNGAGRRKRQRRAIAAIKQTEARARLAERERKDTQPPSLA